MAGRLEILQDTVGKYNCERCGFAFLVSELVEEAETGAVVCVNCSDQVGFNEQKRNEASETIESHFTT